LSASHPAKPLDKWSHYGLCPAKVVRSNGGLRIPGDAERRETVTAVWYVYLLELANSDVYVGSSNDLRRRFKSHQDGQVISTRDSLPTILKCYVAVTDKPAPRRLERCFKSKASTDQQWAEAEISRRAVPFVTGRKKMNHAPGRRVEAAVDPSNAREHDMLAELFILRLEALLRGPMPSAFVTGDPRFDPTHLPAARPGGPGNKVAPVVFAMSMMQRKPSNGSPSGSRALTAWDGSPDVP
jgi:putative endonuclease